MALAGDPEDDRAVLRRVANRDGFGAARELARRHGPSLHRYLERQVGTPLADDALQETLIGAYKGASSFRSEASVRSWLFTIARHATIKLTRKERAEDAWVEPAGDAEDLASLGARAGWGAPPADVELSREEERRSLERALGELLPADREILLLRDVEGLSGEETSAILGLSITATKSRLHRARLKLLAAVDLAGPSKAPVRTQREGR